MKKTLSLIITIIICITSVSCTNKISPEESAAAAHKEFSEAYALMEALNSDFHSIMVFIPTDKDPTISNIAEGLNISEDEYLAGFVEYMKTAGFTEKFNEETMAEHGIYLDNKEHMKELAYLVLTNENNVLAGYTYPFSFLFYAYEANGIIGQINKKLSAGSKLLDNLEADHPDYEHLSKLKEFEKFLNKWNSFIGTDTIADYMKYYIESESISNTTALANELKEIFR